MIKTAVIGAGYWGPNLIRNFYQSELCSLVAVCDINQGNLDKLKGKYDEVKLINDYEELVNLDVEAVCIATPVATHKKIAEFFLKKGIHVLVEKPITRASLSAQNLVDIAKKHNAILMTGHVYMFHPAIRKIREIITRGELGEIKVIQTVRTSLGPRVRNDVNIIWDYFIHEAYILPYILEKKVLGSNCVGKAYLQKGVEDWISASLNFEGGTVANTFVTWSDPQKRRNMTIIGTNKMLYYDEISSQPLTIFNRGYKHIKGEDKFGNIGLELYDKGSSIVDIPAGEPLREEIDHFLTCITSGKEPLSGPAQSVNTIRILENVQQSSRSNGEYKKFNYEVRS